ncbi:MAG: hypothetical protein WCI03_11025 [bacterium]|jgi:hypothetical protein
MNKIMKISGVVVAIMLAGSVTMADSGRGRDNSYRGRDSHSGYNSRCSYQNRGYDRDRHGGYYRGDHGSLAIGLFGLAAVAAVACAASQPDTVYVERQVVYAPPPVVYVQQPARVVYQPIPAQVEYVQQPATMTINVQNSNGSMTPVAMRQIGIQWVGPKGEYYDNLPSVGQLRPVYGF